MVRTSFQARIASVLILLLLVVVGALYFAVQAATTASIRTQAREQLDLGLENGTPRGAIFFSFNL